MSNFINQMEPWFDEKEANACKEYMESGGWLMEFKKTRDFEDMICKYTKAKYCHIVNNGTISLSIALLALNVSKDDEVIVPNLTMIASPNSVRLLGAKPILVDVDEETLCLDINNVEQLLKSNNKIRCVMHVSLNTRCNDIFKLKELCSKYNVFLLEDSAQSLGSFYKGQHLGTIGDIGSFSFSAPKIISTGQGGALVTNSKDMSDKIAKIKNFGRSSGGIDTHDSFGINSKTTDLQSVIGIEQMKKLPWRVKRIREIWDIYYSRLSNNKNIFMFEARDEEWIPWFIDIYIDNKNELASYLKENNVGVRSVYPPVSSQEIYYKINESFPISEKYSKKGLWLPSSTKLTDDQINYICDKILEFYN